MANKKKLNRDEWESAILSAHTTRNWTLGHSKRAQIADALHEWASDQLGGNYGHCGIREVIDVLDDIAKGN